MLLLGINSKTRDNWCTPFHHVGVFSGTLCYIILTIYFPVFLRNIGLSCQWLPRLWILRTSLYLFGSLPIWMKSFIQVAGEVIPVYNFFCTRVIKILKCSLYSFYKISNKVGFVRALSPATTWISRPPLLLPRFCRILVMRDARCFRGPNGLNIFLYINKSRHHHPWHICQSLWHAAYITISDYYPSLRYVVADVLIGTSIFLSRRCIKSVIHRGLYFACHINGATALPMQYADSMTALTVTRLVWPAVTVDNQERAKTNIVAPTS